MKKNYYLLFIIFLLNSFFYAQEKSFTFHIKTNPTDYEYWWLNKNNKGINNSNSLLDINWKFQKSKITYNINVISSFDEKNKVYISESFIKHNFSDKTFLRLGKYYKDFSKYMNDELSSGHMLISHNAEPMPKIGLVTSQAIKRFDKLTFDFGIAHGIFKKDNYYTKAPLLHEKFFYMHIKKNNYRVSLGLVHEAIWAGGTPELGNLPNTFKDFLKVFISADGPLLEGEPHANALGSHIGIWDFSYEKNNNNRILKLYYQHYFEDTSSLRFRNEIDGLWGAELKNYIPNTIILFEYLDTTNAWLDPPYQRDYYYWNYQYQLGWSYQDYILGNPFVSSFKLGKTFHLGVSGEIFSSNYQIKASRKINTNDSIKYKIAIEKTIKDKFDINIFLVNNKKNNGLGLGISKAF